MPKMSLNLAKIIQNQSKLASGSYFFVGQNTELMRRAREEKGMDYNYIHLCYFYHEHQNPSIISDFIDSCGSS